MLFWLIISEPSCGSVVVDDTRMNARPEEGVHLDSRSVRRSPTGRFAKSAQRGPVGLMRNRPGGDVASACASAEADWMRILVDPRRRCANMQRGRNKSLAVR